MPVEHGFADHRLPAFLFIWRKNCKVSMIKSFRHHHQRLESRRALSLPFKELSHTFVHSRVTKPLYTCYLSRISSAKMSHMNALPDNGVSPRYNFKKVAVFCGASVGTKPIFMESARTLGEELVRRKLNLVYG